MKKLLRILSILVILAGAFLVILKTTTRFTPAQPTTTLANPASVYCEQQSGTLEIVTDASGAQSGVCHLVDGTTCEEWAYFRGECPTTGSEVTGAIENLGLTDQNNQIKTYTNNEYGFSLQYPSEWELDQSQLRFFYKDEMPLGIFIYDNTYNGVKGFDKWHKEFRADNILKSTKEITIGKYTAIETSEVDGVDSISTYIFFSNNNHTIVFRGDDNNINSREILLKTLATLEFTK